MKVAIVNFGMGNLGSVRRALLDLGAEAYIADYPEALSGANRMVLPGVGAFAEGMSRLSEGRWVEAIRKSVQLERKPLLGICLGMQMLAAEGVEGGVTTGLSLIEGRVDRLDSLGCRERIPHVGWNEVSLSRNDGLFIGVPDNSDFYFVHSYALSSAARPDVTAVVSYGIQIIAAISKDIVFGTQFHPEKSSKAGRQVLRNFLEIPSC